MGIKIQSTKDVGADGVKLLIYGKAGIGKTTLMSTLQNQIILSAESGLLSLQEFDIPYIEINTLQDIYDAYNWLTESDEAKVYESVGLDSVTEIADVILSTYKREYKDARKAYGDLADDMMELLRKYRDIKGKNIIFSAQTARLVDEDSGITNYLPAMPGKQLLNKVPFYFDGVYFMTSMLGEDNEEYRVLRTQTGIGYEAKDRSKKLKPIEEPHLGKIFSKIINQPQGEQAA